MKILEKIISITIPINGKSGSASETLDAGEVIGVVAYSSSKDNNHNNASMVRAEIATNGSLVSNMQPVDHYRSRDVKVQEDGKPVFEIGGKKVDITVVSSSVFTAETTFDFVFIYKVANENCQY